MNRKIFLIILFSCVLFILARIESVSALSQERAGREIPEYDASVILKLVQVYVSDKSGNAVTDLVREDFELYDNGNLQPITDFEKYTLFIPGEKNQSSLEGEMPTSAKLNRKFYLFFDLTFNTPLGIKNAREAALYFIDHQLQPTDEIGVLSYSAIKSLTTHENLTGNHKKVREAVEGIGLKDLKGRVENLDRQYGEMNAELDGMQQTTSKTMQMDQDIKMIESQEIIFERAQAQQQALVFSKTMKAFGLALSHIQGHKSILYFSTGIPDSIVDHNLNSRYDEMIKVLAASNSSAYSIYDGFQEHWPPGRNPLKKLAAGTGGKYYESIRDHQTIMEEIQQATSSYYVLGYSIGLSWDGKYHKIEIKVRRKGCQVKAQKGYLNPKPFRKLSALEKKLDFVELALEERSQFLAPIGFPIESLFFSVEGISGMVSLAKIPGSAVQELSGKQVELVNLVFDENDDLRHLKGWRIDFTKLPHRDIYYYSLIPFPSGRYKSRIVLRNMETGRAAVSSTHIAIPETREGGLYVCSPLLVAAEQTPAYLKGELIGGQDREKKAIDLADLYPCDFKSFSPVVGDLRKGVVEVTAVIPSHAPENQFPEIKISVDIIDQSTGITIPLPYSMAQGNPGNHIRFFFIHIPLKQLKQGSYVLHFCVEETRTGFKSNTSVALSVK